ncbi:hypothetical protein [Marinobacterium aestuariivivens]|uniref:Oxidoreductase molybdopterin-binding domain-containing protein n=1 Tax=Marinobacterium aestuariivivens TaxID=1698799 RepID=A0ABW1ZYN9_9GAMM
MHIVRQLPAVFSLLLSCMLATLALAGDAPTGKPILTVTGQIDETNQNASFVFDKAMLKQLPQYSFTTGTPWHPEKHRFTGPLLRDVLQRVGASGDNIQAIALNDYKVDIPKVDSEKFDMIIALLMDDEPMSVRNKGPLFVLYPFDLQRESQSQIYYNRAIWQLKALHIE